MHPNLAKEVRVLAEMAEMKRIYASLEASLASVAPASLLITSTARGEGKTLTAAALAIVAATQTTRRVLAVDLNWYAPALHTLFHLNLADDGHPLRDGEPVLERVLPSGIDRLDLLVAPHREPPANRSARGDVLLGVEIMQEASSTYDLVIGDTSSIFPANRDMMDPIVLSRAASGVVMVILANATARQEVKRAYTLLKSSGAPILGVIVNHWKNDLA